MDDGDASDTHSDLSQSVANQESTSATSLTSFSQSRSSTPRPKPYFCTFEHCGKAFTRPCRLQEHVRSHTKERPFACPENKCGKRFFRSTHLSHHVKSAHSNERNYVCDWPKCLKAFATGTRLRRHRTAHEEKDRFRCKEFPPCSELFRKQATLDKHVALFHLNRKPFVCGLVINEILGETCQHAFESTYKLVVHRARVHLGARYWCMLCTPEKMRLPDDAATSAGEMTSAIGFATSALLQAHIQAVHPPICIYCNRPFASIRGLRNHNETAHDPEKTVADRRNHSCDIPGCARAFTRKSNLKAHVRAIHMVKQNFTCGEANSMGKIERFLQINGFNGQFIGCNATFATRRQFVAHIRISHLAPAPVAEYRQSRKTVRKAVKKGNIAQSNAKEKGSISSLEKLTGIAGSEDMNGSNSTAGISTNVCHCIIYGCTDELADDRELQLHMASAHGMAEVEIDAALLEKRALTGGVFWISGEEDGSLNAAPLTLETDADFSDEEEGIELRRILESY